MNNLIEVIRDANDALGIQSESSESNNNNGNKYINKDQMNANKPLVFTYIENLFDDI
jgi:hypothetical protein